VTNSAKISPAEITPTELVNEILERERIARGNITWTEFARQLGVHNVTLWKWRHGHDLGPAANALLPLAAKHNAPTS
jgi:transposase-like protein